MNKIHLLFTLKSHILTSNAYKSLISVFILKIDFFILQKQRVLKRFKIVLRRIISVKKMGKHLEHFF